MESQPMLWVFCLYLQVICSPGSSEEWTADIVPRMKVLTKSCVVIPCTFTYPGNPKSATQQRAIWFEKNDPKTIIYDEDKSKVDNNFKERTKLVGNLGESNCSLEIDHIKGHDAEEFCFRIEIPKLNQYSFKESCVVITTFGLQETTSSNKQSAPKLNWHPQDPVEGSSFTIICSVHHTCPSHVPTLTWSHGTQDKIMTVHKDIGHGRWETQSVLIFTPTQEDDHKEVSCTVTHRGNEPLKSAIKLNVKSKFSVLFYIIIPLVVAAGTAIVFGVLIMFMRKKYKRHPGNYQDGTSRPERRSHGNNGNMDVGYRANNEVISTGGQKASKPRCPSPKSNPKSSANSGKGRNVFRRIFNSAHMEPFAWVLLYGVCFQGAIFGVSWAWSVTVPREMEGMVGSCLVIPCRFSYSEYPPNDKGRVVWYQYVDRGYPLACDPKFANEVIEKFRGKTSLYGSPYKGDCSLKIDPLDWRHQEERVYPWVDPDYVTYRYFKFYDKAVKIRVRDRADEQN